MSQEWMIDVLKDLRSFAQGNGLMALAEQLDDTILIAAAEMAAISKEPGAGAANLNPTGSVFGAHATGEVF